MMPTVRGKIEVPSKVGATIGPGTPSSRTTSQAAVPITEHGLTGDELDDIKQAFDIFDFNGTGTVRPRDIKLALNSLGSDRKALVFRLLDGIEELPDVIEYSAFLSHIVERIGNKRHRRGIDHIFKLFDYDDGGVIDLPKFKRVTKELGEAVSDDKLEQELARNSSSGQPLVTFDDFYVVMTKRHYS